MPHEHDLAANPAPAWHNLSAQQVKDALITGDAGLSATEAEERLVRYGANRLKPPQSRSAIMRFLLQFHNVLIYILLVSSVLTAFLGH